MLTTEEKQPGLISFDWTEKTPTVFFLEDTNSTYADYTRRVIYSFAGGLHKPMPVEIVLLKAP